jgi:MFS family permease
MLVGILSDWHGRRKPFILFGLSVQVFALLLLIIITPDNSFSFFFFLMFCAILGVSFYDTTTDAMAVLFSNEKSKETLAQTFMGVGNAAGFIFFFLSFSHLFANTGNILVSGVMGWMAHSIGWPSVFFLLAMITILPIPFAIFVTEPPQAETKLRLQDFKSLLERDALGLIVYAILFGITTYGFSGLLITFLTETYSEEVSVDRGGLYATVIGIGLGDTFAKEIPFFLLLIFLIFLIIFCVFFFFSFEKELE